MNKSRPVRLPKNPEPQAWLAADRSLQYIADYKPFNMVDGEGIRCSLYVSGCLFNCPGCYNKAAQNFHYGTPYSDELGKNHCISPLSSRLSRSDQTPCISIS